MQKIFTAALLCFAVFTVSASAQENPSDVKQPAAATITGERLTLEKADAEASKASKNLKIEETTPRIPNGYGKVATDEQKKEIRKIIKEYNDIIALLKERIRLLEAERSEKALSVLEPDQQKKIKSSRKKSAE